MHRSHKLLASIFSAVLCLSILWPATENFKNTPTDSFPLSYYPMFTTARDDTYSVSHVLVSDADKRIYNLSFDLIGDGGFNQTRRQISKSVRNGEAQILCNTVANRIIQLGLPEERSLVRVAVVTSTYDLNAYYEGEKTVIKRQVHATSSLGSAPE